VKGPSILADARREPGRESVAVIVTTFEHAHFLSDALESLMAQSLPADEIIVVDDGSSDDPAAVTARFPGVRLVRIENSGLSAARNAGLALARSRFVVFLDADDVLLPTALEQGLACMAANPGAAFVYGAHRLFDFRAGDPPAADPRNRDAAPPQLRRVGPLGYHDFLRSNCVGMHGAAVYDRAMLVESGGFDTTLKCCEDYDIYLRLAKRHRVACHPNVVADYRMHGSNMSANAPTMRETVLAVHARHRPEPGDPAALRAWKEGRAILEKSFSTSVWKRRRNLSRSDRWAQRVEMVKVAPRMAPGAALRQLLIDSLPAPVGRMLRRVRRSTMLPHIGQIDFGDLARIAPISRGFGFKRGTPIDRHYIERFLAANCADIRGSVLEVGAPTYSERFGRGIERQDVLNVIPDVPGTTITGDLGEEDILPEAQFDCIVLTQTLQFVYDMPAAVARLARSLKPGGVLLATVPGLSPIDTEQWGERWFWSLTERSALRLMGDAFGAENVAISISGNAFAATCFLQGIAMEEVGADWLEPYDPAFPVTIAIRAVRA
jgi:GT2 family glycosyltransferase/SAM-dependent methyltransferase